MASLKDVAPLHLHTERLTLELYDHNPEHQDCLLSAINSKTAIARMGDYGIRTSDQFDGFIARSRLKNPIFKDGVADDDLYYLIRLGPHTSDGKLVGGISLAQRKAGDIMLPPDIGWCMIEGEMGKGYAPEAAREVLRWALETVAADGVIVFPDETNRQSNRVAEKLGFVPRGQFVDADRPGHMFSVWALPETKPLGLEDGHPISIYQ